LPPGYGQLGLLKRDLERHIALDIGAARLTEALADSLGVAAIMAAFSRLLIDLNRGIDDVTLIPQTSDGTEIPGNLTLGGAERNRRIERYHESYHRSAAAMMENLQRRSGVPAFLGIHSFTPEMNGRRRPWEVGLLWNRDGRLARYMIAWLMKETPFTVGDNEPYSGRIAGYSMDRHGGWLGRPNAVIEIRQDLIATEEGVLEWAGLLGRLIGDMLRDLSPFALDPMFEASSAQQQ
jgi:predicted N-formylglutamate amidohydrolase